MDKSLKSLLGITDGGKREYRFVSGEVTREDYEYGQLLDTLLFGDGGYVQTLGPTWDLIHDPRFTIIEDAFIVTRRAVFGGDAAIGKQYIYSDGQFTSKIADFDEYATILGEGRYFYYIITHPNKSCPLRNWYLRIFPGMVQKDGLQIPEASVDLQCNCSSKDGLISDPHFVKDWPDEQLWDLIKQECPNYFNQQGNPNGVAMRLFDLFKADLLGLIADYAITPISDCYIELDTGAVLDQSCKENNEDPIPQVFLEVDILERALTQRAVLRATAAKILRQMGFHTILHQNFDGIRLTDIERDTLLRIVYSPKKIGDLVCTPSTNWYGYLSILKGEIFSYLTTIKDSGKSFEEREKEQLTHVSTMAHEKFLKLKTGEVPIINQYTEPEIDVQLDPHAEIMQEILKNPFKQELFMMWVKAEKRASDDNKNDTDRLNMHRMYSILTPIFTDPKFEVDEVKYAEYITEAETLGMFTADVEERSDGTFYNKRDIGKAVEAFHAFAKNHQPDCEWYNHFMNHIDEETGVEFECDHVMPCKCKLLKMSQVEGVSHDTPEAKNEEPI